MPETQPSMMTDAAMNAVIDQRVVDMGTLRMKVYPKRAAVSQQRHSVEDETMRVGLVAQDPFSAHRRLSSASLLIGQSLPVSTV
jgi:hypothetical protein